MSNFAERIRREKGRNTKVSSAENDFPLAIVTSIRVGSAHAVSPNALRDEHLRLLLTKLAVAVNDPQAVNDVQFDFKTAEHTH